MKMPMLSPRFKQLLAARKNWFIFLAGFCLLIPAVGNFLLHAPVHWSVWIRHLIVFEGLMLLVCVFTALAENNLHEKGLRIAGFLLLNAVLTILMGLRVFVWHSAVNLREIIAIFLLWNAVMAASIFKKTFSND